VPYKWSFLHPSSRARPVHINKQQSFGCASNESAAKPDTA
jgi:hypothetical protein